MDASARSVIECAFPGLEAKPSLTALGARKGQLGLNYFTPQMSA
jgi:hypothetical protein